MGDEAEGDMGLEAKRRGAASGKARSLIVLVHGYGADGADLIGLADPLAGVLPDTVFVAPDAPERCSVNPMGFQWFPIPWIDGSSEAAMREGFARSAALFDGWLTRTMAAEGVGPGETALVGFSQGTMMSLHVGPRRAERLAGIVGFSGRLADAGEAAGPVLSTPPVLLVHGDADQVIPVEAIHEAREGLAAQGMAVRWHVCRGLGHGIDPEGLRLAAGFLVSHLRKPDQP
jgi:phospholipase/carboxylesterase